MTPVPYRVAARRREAADTVTLALEPCAASIPDVRPGRYTMLYAFGVGEPPTSQNQAAIEDDMRRVVEGGLDLDDAALTGACERVIRNHDPCISCSAHFLDLTVERA